MLAVKHKISPCSHPSWVLHKLGLSEKFIQDANDAFKETLTALSGMNPPKADKSLKETLTALCGKSF